MELTTNENITAESTSFVIDFAPKTNEYKKLMMITNAIKDPKLRIIVQDILDTMIPDYFWTIPASSSGKYHPDYALGEGGLARHTIACCIFWKDLARAMHLKQREKDITLAALILHDGFKSGYGDYLQADHTVFEHPLLMSNAITKIYSSRDMKAVAKLISSHMGEWNTSKYSNIKLPVPKTYLQRFVHTCDYLASRKYFDVDTYIIDESWVADA